MLQNSILDEILKKVEDAARNLKAKQEVTLEEYLAGWETRDVVERELHKAIQGCMDVGARIISQKNFQKASDYHEVFDILFQEKVISKELAQKMKEMVGLRNALVHEYRKIKHEEIYRHLQESLKTFEGFARAIIRFSKK